LEVYIELDHGSRRLLQGRLFEQLCHLTHGCKLNSGCGCPGLPSACRELGISHNTLWLVSDRLIADGFLHARKVIGELM